MLSFAAQLAVWVAGRLLGLVEAIVHRGFGIVFLDPGQDVFGVQADALPYFDLVLAEICPDQAHRVGQEILEDRIGQLPQHAREMAPSRQAGIRIEAAGKPAGAPYGSRAGV
jgi:hypothetical protein